MLVLDRIGMRWLIVSIAVVPMAIASFTALRLSAEAADDERAAKAELVALERLIALGDYRTSVVNETASYRGWVTSIVPSEIDQDSPIMVAARAGLTRLAEGGAERAADRLGGARLEPDEQELVGEIDERLDAVRSAFTTDAPADDVLADLAVIDALLLEVERATARLVDRRSDDWIVVDLHSEMLSRLAEEVFIVGTMLISGESTLEARQQGALLVAQTDDTFARLLDAIEPDEGTSLVEAFSNEYTDDRRGSVASLTDRFEPLSLVTIAGAPGDLARFGDAAEAVRSVRADQIRADAEARADAAATERTVMLVVAIAAIVIPGLLLIVIARRITRRLDALTDAARRLSEGELGVMVDGVGGTDELALLAQTFNEVSATVSLGHEQVSALADGRLDDEILDQQMPGPVGRTLRTALRRLGDNTAELAHHASHDRLTGLLDRRGFQLARAELDDETQWAVMLVDLDGFKAVNDRLGHAVGDDVLIEVTDRLRAAADSDSTVARLGGDEFAAFVPRERIADVARRLVTSLSGPISVGDDTATVSASVGWTPLARDEELGQALRRSDLAMYDAKNAGRNQIRMRHADDGMAVG